MIFFISFKIKIKWIYKYYSIYDIIEEEIKEIVPPPKSESLLDTVNVNNIINKYIFYNKNIY